MKIAVASDNGKNISTHFGRCSYFLVYETNEGNIGKVEVLDNVFTGHARGECHGEPEHHGRIAGHHGHESIINALKDCSVVISNGMGQRLWEDLAASGIRSIITDETDAARAVEMFLKGKLKSEPKGTCGHERL